MITHRLVVSPGSLNDNVKALKIDGEEATEARTSKMGNTRSADHSTLQQRKVQTMNWQKTSSRIS